MQHKRFSSPRSNVNMKFPTLLSAQKQTSTIFTFGHFQPVNPETPGYLHSGLEVLLSEIRLQLWGRVGSWLARCCASRGKNAGWRLAPCVQHLVVPTNSGCCRAPRCSSGTSHVVVCELASSSAGRPVEEIQRQGNLGKHQYFTYLFVFPNSKPVFTPNSNNCNNNNNLKPKCEGLI